MPEPARFSGRAAPGGGSRSALAVGALTLVFVVLALAKPWDLPNPSLSPSTAPSATLAPTPGDTPAARRTDEPTPAPVPDPVPFKLAAPPRGTWTTIRWRRIGPTSPVTRLATALRWSGGYASLGDDGMGGSRLWTSPDGITWSPIGSGTATTFWPGMRVEAVAPLGRQLLAVTSLPADDAAGNPLTPSSRVLATWLSDTGAKWQLSGGPILPEPTTLDGPIVAAGSGGRAAIAWNEVQASGGQSTGRVVVTDDGNLWRPVPTTSLPSGFQVMDMVAAPGAGFLLAGRTLVDGSAVGAIVRSDATGRVWAPVALPQDPALAIGEEQANVVWRLLAGANGLLATGSGPHSEMWWRSADGRQWTPVPAFDPLAPAPCPGPRPCTISADGLVAGDGVRIVAVGGAGLSSTLHAWTSPDAAAWRRVTTRGSVLPARPADITLLPGGILVTGSSGAWYGEATSAAR